MRGAILILVSAIFAFALELTGAVYSDNQKIITSRFMGFVKNIYVSEGDIVKKGDLLYEIDSKDIDAKKRQALMQLQMYKDKLMNVELNLGRFKRLLKKDMVSKYEVENLELARKNLLSMIEIAKAQLEEVNNQYKYLKIKAPNDGVIIQKNIKVGEMALPGMPAMVLSDLSNLKVVVEVSESNLKKVRLGKKVKVIIPSIKANLDGKISAIIPSSNPMTHTFRIKVSFDKKNLPIYPGMYAKVIIK